MEIETTSGASSTELSQLLHMDRFPRASARDPMWAIDNRMGPNVLWLTEWVVELVELRPGMKVLDIGCGKAISSIFMAQEWGVQVWATDLWIPAAENMIRIREAGVEDRVFPIHAEAHALPFAAGFFDAAVSMDAYHYFGTDDLYLGYYTEFIRPGGLMGVVVPGVRQELGASIPRYLRPHWEWDFCSFHSPDWWREHWLKTGLVEDAQSDWLEGGAELWLRWLDACNQAGGRGNASNEALLRADAGRNLGFVRATARRR